MIYAGLDCGARNTRALLWDGMGILARSAHLTTFEPGAVAKEVLEEALRVVGAGWKDVAHITATGTGKRSVDFAHSTITEVSAGARAISFLFPQVRTLVDVGAEEGRAIKLDASGKVVDFAINEKCAAGAGTFVETMARTLEVSLEDMGTLALRSSRSVPMNAQCAVFAESEVVSLIHSRTPKEDIARAIHDAIAERISSLVRRVGMEKEVALIGGMAKNIAFVEALKRNLDTDIILPEGVDFIGALGAAFTAKERG